MLALPCPAQFLFSSMHRPGSLRLRMVDSPVKPLQPYLLTIPPRYVRLQPCTLPQKDHPKICLRLVSYEEKAKNLSLVASVSLTRGVLRGCFSTSRRASRYVGLGADTELPNPGCAWRRSKLMTVESSAWHLMFPHACSAEERATPMETSGA